MKIELKVLLLCVAVLVAAAAYGKAQESVTLTTPVTRTATAQHVAYVGLDLDNSRIVAQVLSNTGDVTVKTYDATTTPTGASLLSTLNTSNNSAGTSLIKRIYQRLQTDGVIAAGSIVGTPQ